MSNPQQPELRRSGKASTDSKSADAVRETKKRSGRSHGTDKGRKGGGKGGGVPPAQRPQHPE
ncbi:hypothetical protein HD597_001349 [Nonomuraea thailandensis]|uniref:Uncharacterized protein n=1 Tax=Nonomuraea thailandensis TaxID=1188745 RepID=A0A9X2G854_9ACTN|nr:hypothetical protein [Nonomuraea thailandensis]MCP2354329.1 hypothetical protein [Nonomuraea thailandensis]